MAKSKSNAAAKPSPSAKPSASAKSPSAATPAPRKPAPVAEPKAGGKAAAPAPAKVAAAPVASAAAAPAAAKPATALAKPAKPSRKSALRESILARKAASKPIAFSLDEVRAIAKTNVAKVVEISAKPVKAAVKPAAGAAALALERPAKPNHIKAASLADILGFNPKKARPAVELDDSDVPEKFKRYYKLLIDLRTHLTEGIERHSEETLKRSAKEDSGDLSSYGQHMADAGTDTFDRDFALSLVSSEQEALSEIDAAIKRVRDGSYGICEITAKPIAKERLLAVPFTRYSAEAQKDIERNRHRSRTQAGLFGEGEEGGKIMEEDGGEE
jgi:RNA polymerase-binding transcription factor DksA